MRRFSTRWVPLKEAARFIAVHHRHHDPVQGGIIALGLWEGEALVGVGVLGRPVSRALQAAGAVEVTRLCVRQDSRHAASALLAALRRVGQALGFARIVTYTLAEEGGASLRAAGWQAELQLVEGGEWNRQDRPRLPATHPTGRKVRWWVPLRAQREIIL